MSKKFLLIFIVLYSIAFIAVGSLYIISLREEKSEREGFEEAFAVPTPTKDIPWTVNRNVTEEEALYVVNLVENMTSEPVALEGTEWVFTEVVENEKDWYSSLVEDMVFTNFGMDWFADRGWYGVQGVSLNDVYRLCPEGGMGVSGYRIGYVRLWDGYVRVVILRKDVEDTVVYISDLPYPGLGRNYPFNIWYRIFVSDIVPVENVLPEL